MNKFMRLIVLVTGLMAVLGAGAAGAGASSWTNSGDTTFTATTGASTLTANGVSLTCTSETWTVSAPATEPGPDYVMTGTSVGSGCRIAGAAVSRNCTWRTDITSTSAGISMGTITVNCVAGSCTVTGTTAISYTNPRPPTPGKLTAPATTTLRVGGAGCLLGPGAAALTAQTMTVITGLVRGMLLRQP